MGASSTKVASPPPPPPLSHAEMQQHLVDDSMSDYMKDFYAERPFTNEDWKWFFKSDDQKRNWLDQELKKYWAQ